MPIVSNKKPVAKKPVAKKPVAKKPVAKKVVVPVIMKTITSTNNVVYLSTPPPQEQIIYATFSPPSQDSITSSPSSVYLTTSLAPNVMMTSESTTISPLMMVTQTMEPVKTFYDAYPNLNFNYPILSTNSYQYIFTTSSYTPIQGWTITTRAELNPERSITVIPTPQAVSFLLGNGTGGPFRFTTINDLGLPSITQFGMVQYSSNTFDGTYYITFSYDINLDAIGDYLLTYYVQARPLYLATDNKTWNVKYTDKHTIKASINNYSTTDFSLGNELGVWKKQELPFTISEAGKYSLQFISTLNNLIGTTDSTIAFGAISVELV
jgi:hypothetical protein